MSYLYKSKGNGMKNIYAAILAAFLFAGCGSDEDPASTGVHFQGRDCLSCHNKDLGVDSHLLVGGTVYKEFNSTKNDLNDACSEKLHIEFGAPTLSTKDYNPANAAGFNGRGNVFALLRDGMDISGSYIVSIVNDDRSLIQSSATPHEFTASVNLANPADNNASRYSCNVCHQDVGNNINSAPGLLYATGCK